MRPNSYIQRLCLLAAVGLATLMPGWATAQTYAFASETYNWIDTASHTHISSSTALPARFYKASGCGTTPPTIDDTITDPIPLGFTFNYGGVDFTSVRVMTNGRLQFGTNATCGSGTDNSGATIYTFDYPDANMNYTMRIYGADLDPTPKTGATSTYGTTCLNEVQCYVSYATLGTAPNRTFVVTWNNVPKWIQSGKIAGNFNLQIILQENGEFVYQFGDIQDVPGVPAQIGWQVQSTYDFNVVQTALPTNYSALRFYIPRPIAQYQMEQSSWSGAAGEVLDTSGYGRHAVAVGTGPGPGGGTAVTASGYACRGANIPQNQNVNQIAAIDTGISVPTTIGSAGTIAFWYKPTSWVGPAAANTNAQLLDATTVTGEWFFLTKVWVSATTSKLRFVVQDRDPNTGTGTLRVVETAAMTTSVLNNGWVHIAVSWNFNALPAASSDHLRIYVNGLGIGATGSNSVQSAFTSSGFVSPAIGTLYLGDNRSGFTAAPTYPGTGNSANGVLDEVRIFNFEGGLGLILGDKTRPNTCAVHYAVSHSGTGYTCQATPITLSVHDGNHATMQSQATVQLSTSSGKGDWTLQSGFGTLTPGAANSGTATYRFGNEAQAVLLFNQSTAGSVNFNVSDGSISELEDPVLTIGTCTGVNAFNGCEYSAARCTPPAADYDRLFTKLAGRAFKLDGVALSSSGTVDTTFSSSVTVDLLANVSPQATNSFTHCPATQVAVIPLGTTTFASGRLPVNGVAVAANAFSSVSPGYSAYRDVRMRFTCSAANCPPSGLTMCSTDNFAVRPTDIVVTSSSMTNTSGTTGTPKQVAGSSFPMAAQAKDAAGNNALGYNGSPTINTTLAQQRLATHVNLTDYTDKLRDFTSNTTISFTPASAASGLASGTFYYLDYGGFRVLANGVQDASFVSSSVDVPGKDCDAGSASNADTDADAQRERFGCVVGNQSNSALIGRFYPSTFVLNSSALTPACTAGAFTYQGQALGLAATVSAMSDGTVLPSAVMPHYSAGTVAFAAENANSGTNLAGRLTVPAGSWSGGVYTLSTAAATFSRAASPDGPYDALDIGIIVTDADGANLGATRNMNPTTSVVCSGAACTHQRLGGASTIMRFGRLRMLNALGSERLDLPVPVEAQYWNGTVFARNTVDSCTTLAPANVNLLNYQGGITSSNLGLANVASVGALTSGLGSIVLTKPSPVPSALGSVDVLLNLGSTGATVTCPTTTPASPLGASISAAMPYLSNKTCSAAAYDRNPVARATFGVYRSPLVYLRENY